MHILRKNILVVIGVLAGTVAGYLYWHYIGCQSGTCPITSRPLHSSLYGAVMGGLLFSLFQNDKKETI
jgi:phage shock protein E